MEKPSLDAIASRNWDFIVVGTGIGGGTIAYALARAGCSVLMVEKGRSYLDGRDVIEGDWLEALMAGQSAPTDDHKKRAGRFADVLVDVSGASPRPLRPFLGSGSGGSSALYGMVMERFFPSDFSPGRYFRDIPGHNAPRTWPISYDELDPFYGEAEAIYGVRATNDPLHPAQEGRGISEPPPLTPASRELVDRFERKGLHPYRLPMACDYVPGCTECIGYICKRRCKRDSTRSCVEPAIRDYGATLLAGCEVDTLEEEGGRIRRINARLDGKPIQLRAETVILSAGAIGSPALLLRSGRNGRGLANGSDQVGRNLMRHLIDYYLLYPDEPPSTGPLKQIAFNDLYVVDGRKLGTMQSNGRLPPNSSLVNYLRDELRLKWGPLAHLFPLLRPAVEYRIRSMLDGAHVMIAYVEDLPYAQNRIRLGSDGRTLELSYKIPPADMKRVAEFRSRIRDILKPHRFGFIPRVEQNGALGHMCGTCRFGDDPGTSVLDRNNRTHDIENLYVVDTSFLPTSGGTNPSLTVAANALRVAGYLTRSV